MSSMHFMKLAAVFLASLTFGCSDKSDEGASKSGDTEHHEEPESEVETAFKGLSEADQKLARAQKTCPVSGEALGSMGTPIKVSGAGRTVFLCCEGCRKTFEKDPAKYVEKLGG